MKVPTPLALAITMRDYKNGSRENIFMKDIYVKKKFLGLIPYKSYQGFVSVVWQEGVIFIERRDKDHNLNTQIRTFQENGGWDDLELQLEDMENQKV